jgi:hypothetical protein
MLTWRTHIHRISVAVILVLLCHHSMAQNPSPPEQVKGLWQVHFEEAPAKLQNTVMELMPAGGDPNRIAVKLFYGNTAFNHDGTGFEVGEFLGTSLEAKGGWYTDPRLLATFDGSEFTGRVEYSDDAIYFFRAERLITKIAAVDVVRNINWKDRSRGIDSDIGALTTAPLHADDVQEAWDSAFSNNDLPGLSVVLRGENLPLHGNASRKLDSSDPKIFAYADWWSISDDGSLVAPLKLRAGTEPGVKTLFLNGMPIEWELKFTMTEAELGGFYTWKHVDGQATLVQEPILLGSRVNFVMAFDGGKARPAEAIEVALSQPGASNGRPQTISLTAPVPGADARVSDQYLLLPSELEGRWKSLVGDKLVKPLFLESGQDVVATFESTTVEAFKLLQPARIDYAFAIDPQEGISNESGVPYMRYPFVPGLSVARRANNERIIMVVGDNLPRNLDDIFELESYGQPIHYAPYRYQSQDEPNHFDNRRMFDRGWARLAQIAAGFDGAPTRDNSEYMLILATLEENALPGFQQIYLNGDFAPWRLQYGDNAADVRFARDLGDGAFEGTGHLYFTERFAVENLPDLDVGRADYELIVRRFRNQETTEPQEYGEPIRLLATRTIDANGRVVYRTPSLDLRPDNRTNRGRPASPDVIQLPVEKDTILTASLTSPELIMTRSTLPGMDAMAEVAVTPDELGVLWADTLRRVGQCYNEIPDLDWRALAKDEAENQLSINVLYANDDRNDVIDKLPIRFGHVAAAVLLRDHFISLMQGTKDHWQAVKSDQTQRSEFVNSLLSGRLDYDDPLYKAEITNPAGQPTILIESLLPAEILTERYSIDNAELDNWRSVQMEVALQQVVESIDESIEYAKELGDCAGEELVELTGMSFDTVAADLEPRLVRLTEFRNPQRLEWEPDVVARSWLKQVDDLAANIEEIESRHVTYVQIGLSGIALASGVGAPLILSETNIAGLVAAEVVSFAADVAMVALDFSSNIERRALLSRALGSSRVLGNDVYLHASEYGVSDEVLMFSVLMAVGGISTSSLSASALVAGVANPSPSWAGATVKGSLGSSSRALIESVGNTPLSQIGPAGQAAVLEAATISYAKRLSLGTEALDEFDRLPIEMYETHLTAQGTNSLEEVRDAWAPLVRQLPASETDPTLIAYSNKSEFDDIPYSTSDDGGALPTTIIEPGSPNQSSISGTVIGDPDATLPPPTVTEPGQMRQADPAPAMSPDTSHQPGTGAAPGGRTEQLDPLTEALAEDIRQYDLQEAGGWAPSEAWTLGEAEIQSRSAYVLEGFLEGGDSARNWAAVRAGQAWKLGVPVDDALAVTGQSLDEFADSLDRWLRDVWDFPNSGERAGIVESYLGERTPRRIRDKAWDGWFNDPSPIRMQSPDNRVIAERTTTQTPPPDSGDPLSLPTVPRPASPNSGDSSNPGGLGGYLEGMQRWTDAAVARSAAPPADPTLVARANQNFHALDDRLKIRAARAALEGEAAEVYLLDGVDVIAARLAKQPAGMDPTLSHLDALLHAIALRGTRPVPFEEIMALTALRGEPELVSQYAEIVATATGATIEGDALVPVLPGIAPAASPAETIITDP